MINNITDLAEFYSILEHPDRNPYVALNDFQRMLDNDEFRNRWSWEGVLKFVAVKHEDGSFFKYVGAHIDRCKMLDMDVILVRPEHHPYIAWPLESIVSIEVMEEGAKSSRLIYRQQSVA